MPMPKRINRSPVRGATKGKLYARWSTIRARCANPTNTSFGGYGGRGIKLCEERKDYFKFEEDMLPSYVEGLTIDRIDNDGDYCKENCRWVTPKEQCYNKRNNKPSGLKGVKHNKVKGLSRICKEYGIPTTTVRHRIDNMGMSLEDALTKKKLRGYRYV